MRRRVSPVVLATAAYVLGYTAHMTLVYYLLPIALRVGGDAGKDAWVFAGTAAASIVAVLPFGSLADVWPRRRVLRIGLALLALDYVPLLVLSPGIVAGVIATLITGTGLAALVVATNSYLADLLAAEGMSEAYGRLSAIAVLASALGPLVAASVFFVAAPNATLALRVSAALFGSGALVGAALTFLLPSAESVRAQRRSRGGSGGALSALREERATVLPIALLYALVGIGYGLTYPYYAVYFLDVLRASKEAWGVVLGLGTVASALGALAVGRLARGGARSARVTLVPPQALLAATSLAFLFPLGVPLLALAYVFRGLCSSTLAPAVNALSMGRVAPHARARVQAWSNLAWNVGWVSGAAVGGALLAAWGGAVFAVGGVLAVLGAAAGAAMLSDA